MYPPFSNSNDVSLVRTTALATEQTADDETGAPPKCKAKTRSITFCISSAGSIVG